MSNILDMLLFLQPIQRKMVTCTLYAVRYSSPSQTDVLLFKKYHMKKTETAKKYFYYDTIVEHAVE